MISCCNIIMLAEGVSMLADKPMKTKTSKGVVIITRYREGGGIPRFGRTENLPTLGIGVLKTCPPRSPCTEILPPPRHDIGNK